MASRPLPVRIVSTGRYLPRKHVPSETVDGWLGLPVGTSAQLSGVQGRYYADGETASEMGAAAAQRALESAGLDAGDIDVLIAACGTPEQPIPSNAALMLKRLGPEWAGKAAFDLGATCMSFLVALDLAAVLLAARRYGRALIVAADVASCGLNHDQPEAAMLFGDAAAAAVVGRVEEDDPLARRPSRILAARCATWAEGSSFTEIRGGGSALPAHQYTAERRADFLFHMEGSHAFRMAARTLPPLLERVLADAGGLDVEDFDLVIPHQASSAAMELMRRRLEIPLSRWVQTLHKYGNTIAASIPLALDECVREGRLERGDRVLLLATAAGFSASALAFDY